MGPIRSIKVRGLRRLGRLDVRLDGANLVLIGPSGSGKSTLLAEVTSELEAEIAGRRHPASDVTARGGTDRDVRMAFVSRPAQLRWDIEAPGAWRNGRLVALALDDDRGGERVSGPLDDSPRGPRDRLAEHLEPTLVERARRQRAALDPKEARTHEARLLEVQSDLRLLLDEPRLRLDVAERGCVVDFGDGRRVGLRELPRAQRAAVGLFAEVTLRIEHARQRMAQPTFDPWGVVLIDGAERDLDPRMQRALLPALAARHPRVQWIVATHSPFVALGLDDAVICDVQRRELRDTATLRKEGLGLLAARMMAVEPPRSPATRPPPPPTRRGRIRQTRSGNRFSED